jgi:hypothetical protein
MICTTCLHSVTQTFANGEMTSGLLFCKVLMRDMKGNLVKCGGYEMGNPCTRNAIEREMEKEDISRETVGLTTTFNIPFLEARDRGEIPKGEPLLSIDKNKPLTQSERMKEYWRNKKSNKE